MAADSIEREILIEASPEVVWGVITEPEQISRWFSDEADVEGRAGADGTLTWRPGGRGGEKDPTSVVPIRVVEAEPFRRFSFRWNHPEGTDAGREQLGAGRVHPHRGGRRDPAEGPRERHRRRDA